MGQLRNPIAGNKHSSKLKNPWGNLNALKPKKRACRSHSNRTAKAGVDGLSHAAARDQYPCHQKSSKRLHRFSPPVRDIEPTPFSQTEFFRLVSFLTLSCLVPTDGRNHFTKL